MKTWTETLTLAALVAVLTTLAACGPGVGNVTPDIDEEAVAKVQAGLEHWRYANPVADRGVDPDLDEKEIRDYAKGHDPSEMCISGGELPPWRRNPPGCIQEEWHNPIPLNEAEIELLLDRMRAEKARNPQDLEGWGPDGIHYGSYGIYPEVRGIDPVEAEKILAWAAARRALLAESGRLPERPGTRKGHQAKRPGT